MKEIYVLIAFVKDGIGDVEVEEFDEYPTKAQILNIINNSVIYGKTEYVKIEKRFYIK